MALPSIMESMEMDNIDKVVPLNGRRYGEDVKQLAYEMWRTRPSMTMKELEAGLRELNHEVPADTLSDWRDKRNWQGRFQEELLALGPQYARAHVAGLRVGAPEAIQKLRNHAQNPQKYPLLPSQQRALEFLVKENRILLIKGLEAANLPADPETIIDTTLTDEQLLELEEGQRQPGATY